jgi:hypothetical protein
MLPRLKAITVVSGGAIVIERLTESLNSSALRLVGDRDRTFRRLEVGG